MDDKQIMYNVLCQIRDELGIGYIISEHKIVFCHYFLLKSDTASFGRRVLAVWRGTFPGPINIEGNMHSVEVGHVCVCDLDDYRNRVRLHVADPDVVSKAVAFMKEGVSCPTKL